MKREFAVVVVALAAVVPSRVAAQSGLAPSYSAPVRPFERSEIGVLITFPDPGGIGWEGTYRAVSGAFDVGIRGGIYDPGVGPSSTLARFEARSQVVRHKGLHLFDAAVVFAASGEFRSGATRFSVPIGFSVGRRIRGNRPLSLMPYIQPTALLHGGQGMPTRLLVGIGVGADLRLFNHVDLRLSSAVGQLHGASLGVVLLR